MEKVTLKVKPNFKGFYDNTTQLEGEEFDYRGGLNALGELPSWTEPVDAKEAEAYIKAKKEQSKNVKAEAPKVAKPTAALNKEVKISKPEVKASALL